MFLFTIILALLHCAIAQTGLQVNTTEGYVQGGNATDGNYYTFYGLRYGANTAGENRFKAPLPAPAYPGNFTAHNSPILCAQPSVNGIIGDEDCLTVNIFTNGTTPAKPVLVWLQGEEYTNTYSKIEKQGNSFKTLVTQGLVVVQMNYRLSIFGFLCLGVPEAPGNAGLKDIVLGLKWIKKNIAGFGGDPNNVILFGHGSAAAMVDLITLSPLANGLVHKAIAFSGSALAPWAVSYTPEKYAHAFGEKLAYSGLSNQDLAKHLLTTDRALLSNALNEFSFQNNSVLFAPCIENVKLNPNDTFLADAPLNILKSRNYSEIPYITGYTNQEGTMRAEQAVFAKPTWLEAMDANFTNFLPLDLNFGNNLTNEAKKIRAYYFDQPINMDTINDFLAYQGDTLVLLSVIRGAKERAATSTSEVRLLEFAHRGTRNTDWTYTTVPLTGARHGIILNYLLDEDLNESDQVVKNALINRIIAFSYSGTPNTASQPQWPKVTDALEYLLYSGGDNTPTPRSIFAEEPKTNPHSQRRTFWDDIYFKYYIAPQPVSSGMGVIGAVFVVFVSQMVLSIF